MSTLISMEEAAVEVIEVAGAALEKAAAIVDASDRLEKTSAEKIPVVVGSLIEAGMLAASDKEACARLLRNPLDVLEMLKLAADEVKKVKLGDGGLPGHEVSPNGDPSGHKKAASAQDWKAQRDAEFDRALGVAQ